MPDQPTAPSVLEPDEVAQLVLRILLDRHPALVAFEELTGDLANPDIDRRPVSPVFIREGIDDLVRCGLAHRLDRFAFASYSAVRANELAF